MNLQERRMVRDAEEIGRIFLKQWRNTRVEAFPGNALYCNRGLQPMNEYKSVGEVCAITGLTRKQLYYFHHEKVVRAVAYANYSVEGHNGYKLYDEEAVQKLRQIALYYQLGMTRSEIRDLMRAPDYDCNRVLENLLALEKDKQVHIARNIAALEYLIRLGTKNGVNAALDGIRLEELGKLLLQAEAGIIPERLEHSNMEAFFREFQLSELGSLTIDQLTGSVGEERIQQLWELCIRYMGKDGTPFLLGVLLSALGEGTAAQRFSLPPTHAEAMIAYIIAHENNIQRRDEK